MNATARHLLESFDHLADAEKKELATEILRRTLQLDYSPITDDELISLAEERFLEMEKDE